MHYAMLYSSWDVVLLFVQHGLDLTIADVNGDTALSSALEYRAPVHVLQQVWSPHALQDKQQHSGMNIII